MREMVILDRYLYLIEQVEVAEQEMALKPIRLAVVVIMEIQDIMADHWV
jgi:hypothetical protein